MSLPRRRFLTVFVASFTGVVFAPQDLLALPTPLVLRLGGQCSFCGKDATQARGLAAAAGRGARICGECVGLCLDIMREEAQRADRPAPSPSVPKTPAEMDALLARLQEASAHDELSTDEFERVVSQLLEAERQRDADRRQQPVLACSFCDLDQDNVSKLIAGPTAYVCDGCVAGSAALLRVPYG